MDTWHSTVGLCHYTMRMMELNTQLGNVQRRNQIEWKNLKETITVYCVLSSTG